MLERATACLNAGARQPESLRCVRRALRSRRTLHSTFWSHATRNLDLPPWAVSGIPDRSHNGGSSKSGARTTAESSQQPLTCSTSEGGGVFLDFLYPPQALAYLYRTTAAATACTTPQREPWERRNARRLPDGFVQASRGYASRSRPSASAGVDDEEDRGRDAFDDVSPEFWEKNRNKPKRGFTRAGAVKSPRRSYGDGELEDVEADEGEPDTATSVKEPEQEEEHDESDPDIVIAEAEREEDDPIREYLAESPGDLAELEGRDTDAHRELRQLLARKTRHFVAGGRETDPTPRALELYRSLSDELRKPLTTALLHWLAERKTDSADQNFVSIFESVELESRNSRLYTAAFPVFLRLGVSMVDLHQEALKTCSSYPQLFQLVFRNAVQAQDWTSAMHFRNQFFVAFGSEVHRKSRADVRDHRLSRSVEELEPEQLEYWNSALDSLDLMSTTPSIIKWCQDLLEKDGPSLTPLDSQAAIVVSPQRFTVLFCRRMTDLLIENLRVDGKLRTQYQTNDLLAALRFLLDNNDFNFTEGAIFRLLREYRYYAAAWVDEVVSQIYLAYRNFPKAHASRRTLQELLQWAARTEVRAARLDEISVPIDMIVYDWERQHEKLGERAISFLRRHYATVGTPEQVEEYLGYGKATKGDNKSGLHNLISVHAEQGDVIKAKEAFEHVRSRFAEENAVPDLECWLALLEAYRRTNDVHGALSTYEELMNQTSIKCDERVFQKVATLLAKRGDVESVQEVIEECERVTSSKRSTRLVLELMSALIHNGELSQAQELLQKSIELHREGMLTGGIAPLFNIMLFGCAVSRDPESTMRVFQAMKASKVPADERSYSALLHGLSFYRHTDMAFKVLRTRMQDDGIRPTAAHFAIVMAGYLHQRMYKHALWVHAVMQNMNVKESRSTRSLYLQNKARLERQMTRESRREMKKNPPDSAEAYEQQENERLDLEDSALISLEELSEEMLENQDPEQKVELKNMRNNQMDFGHTAAAYFSQLAFVYGSHRCIEALRQLCAGYRLKGTTPPMDIVPALMQSFLAKRQYEEVETLWNIAKTEADRLTKPISIPRPDLGSSSVRGTTTLPNTATLKDIDRSLESVSPGAAKPSAQLKVPGRRLILSRSFFYYLRALVALNRIGDAISSLKSLLSEGYGLDNLTWNHMVEYLCMQSPPLASLAYVLAERFLIPGWPGWHMRRLKFQPRDSDIAAGLQHVKARYVKPDALIPRYRTLIRLGATFLDLRYLEAAGRRARLAGGAGDRSGLDRYVGSMKQIREQAPKTLFAVQSMPKVDDYLQRTLIRREQTGGSD